MEKKIGGGGVGRVEGVGAPPRNNHPIPQALLCVNMPTSFEKLRRREKPRRGGRRELAELRLCDAHTHGCFRPSVRLESIVNTGLIIIIIIFFFTR